MLPATFTLTVGLCRASCPSHPLAFHPRAAHAAVPSRRCGGHPYLAGFMGAAASEMWFLAFALTSAANALTLGLIDVISRAGRVALCSSTARRRANSRVSRCCWPARSCWCWSIADQGQRFALFAGWRFLKIFRYALLKEWGRCRTPGEGVAQKMPSFSDGVGLSKSGVLVPFRIPHPAIFGRGRYSFPGRWLLRQGALPVEERLTSNGQVAGPDFSASTIRLRHPRHTTPVECRFPGDSGQRRDLRFQIPRYGTFRQTPISSGDQDERFRTVSHG